MGLTIHYTLHAASRSPSAIRALVAKLRRHALSLPFHDVSPIVHLSGTQCLVTRDDDPYAWLKEHAHWRPAQLRKSAPPSHVPYLIAFSIHPAHGSEQADFGFYSSPPRPNSRAPRLPSWSWHSFCKTQFASNPSIGGLRNFLQAHLGIIALLDFARQLGVLAAVNDEGLFWKRRSLPDLRREIEDWNRFIAAGYGILRDTLETAPRDSLQVQSPISAFPNFEHLEAAARLK